jgi:hypothetical protein
VSSLSQWQLNFSQTPMPYIIAVHMKQATTMLLFVLPFTLVDILGIKMVPLMFLIALTYMGIEGIAAKVEMPFGESVCVLEATQPAESCSDPCDLNLDLYWRDCRKEKTMTPKVYCGRDYIKGRMMKRRMIVTTEGNDIVSVTCRSVYYQCLYP